MRSSDAAERYRECIDNLPPITVVRGRVLVDGFHRWQAHKRENQDVIQAEDLGNLTDAEIFRESIKRKFDARISTSQFETVPCTTPTSSAISSWLHQSNDIS